MKNLILWAIKFYRRFIKPKYARACIFEESCSAFVERLTNEKGGMAGLQALWERVNNCRPGYTFYFEDSARQWRLISVGGKHYERSLLSPSVIWEGDRLQKWMLSVKQDSSLRIFKGNPLRAQTTFKKGGIHYVGNSNWPGELG